MTFEEKYEPTCFDELVFEEQVVQQTLRDFATGQRDKHLLFYGSWGVGKSTTAKVIARERSDDLQTRKTIDIYSALEVIDNLQSVLQKISNGWWIQQSAGLRMPVAVIDEVHLLQPVVYQYRLRAFMDRATHGRFIFTAQNLHQLDRGLINRCLPVEIKQMSVNTMRERSSKILALEKCSLDDDLLDDLLDTVDGNWREGLTALEEAVLHKTRAAAA